MRSVVVPTTEDASTSRLLQSTVHAREQYGIYLGKTLGLYAALDARGAMTAIELGRQAGVARRYAREWLEQQAVAGVLVVSWIEPQRPRMGPVTPYLGNTSPPLSRRAAEPHESKKELSSCLHVFVRSLLPLPCSYCSLHQPKRTIRRPRAGRAIENRWF